MTMRSGKTEKLAAIDIGTNSTRLLVVYTQKQPCKKIIYPSIAREMQITRLGKNTDRTGVISPDSSDNTIKVLERYSVFLKQNGISRFRVVGTRVLRQAKNSADFIVQAYNKTGFKIETISGAEEARLSFIGATLFSCEKPKIKNIHSEESAFRHFKNETDINKPPGKNILVIDIGGGSTEFILGTADGEIRYIESIDIGSVVLSEKFLLHSKPEKREILELEDFISKKLAPVISRLSDSGYGSIIGLAGTISSLASIDLALKSYDRDKIHGYCITAEKICDIYNNRLCSTDLEGRKMITGLDPGRADIIIGGAAIIIRILEMLHAESLTVSESDILEGIICSIF